MADRTELLKSMKYHQEEYAKLASELKALKQAEQAEHDKVHQMARLEAFKAKYKFYVKDLIPIDWEEVEKLVTVSYGRDDGYALGHDETGMPGLIVVNNGAIAAFSPMIEEEGDARKYNEREEKRREIAARKK